MTFKRTMLGTAGILLAAATHLVAAQVPPPSPGPTKPKPYPCEWALKSCPSSPFPKIPVNSPKS